MHRRGCSSATCRAVAVPASCPLSCSVSSTGLHPGRLTEPPAAAQARPCGTVQAAVGSSDRQLEPAAPPAADESLSGSAVYTGPPHRRSSALLADPEISRGEAPRAARITRELVLWRPAAGQRADFYAGPHGEEPRHQGRGALSNSDIRGRGISLSLGKRPCSVWGRSNGHISHGAEKCTTKLCN